MRDLRWTNFLLAMIVVLLAALVLTWTLKPRPVAADSGAPYPFYIEPGTQMLIAPDASKQVLGRVVVDMRSGDIWGFPTNSPNTYPTNSVDTKPQTSRPFRLGKFAFADTDK